MNHYRDSVTVFLVVIKKDKRAEILTPAEALDQRFHLTQHEAEIARRDAGFTHHTADIFPATIEYNR